MSGFLLGFDIGSSFIKASILDIETSRPVVRVSYPEEEMKISAAQPGWAEQDPELWWNCIVSAVDKIKKVMAIDYKNNNIMERVQAIGISYQMHGLVMIDSSMKVLQPSIIWCDSRAVEIGNRASRELGEDYCMERYLNLPGNFTASKLRWVKENQPALFEKIYKVMLPGDYIAMRMTGEINTTQNGLSEGIMWDYSREVVAERLLDYYEIPEKLIPDQVPVFSIQGRITKAAAEELCLKPGIPVSYRAGDQPNNAFSLNALEPGEVAATAGTSGVIYGISDVAKFDRLSRVNTFLHVNHTSELPRYGALMCINGTGILNSWVKHNVTEGLSYNEINELAATVAIGSDGLAVLPFGNGAERILENKNIGCSINGLSFTSHGKEHIMRAAQEGVVFAFCYGLEIMKSIGIDVKTVRAAYSNMFLSPLFREVFSSATNTVVQLYETEGADGAARGAGIGSGIFSDQEEAFRNLKAVSVIETKEEMRAKYWSVYQNWLKILQQQY